MIEKKVGFFVKLKNKADLNFVDFYKADLILLEKLGFTTQIITNTQALTLAITRLDHKSRRIWPFKISAADNIVKARPSPGEAIR